MTKKVVSFSLWGNNRKYLVGAIANARLCPGVYPGWTPRFYVGGSVPGDVVAELRSLGSEIELQSEQGDWRGMLWRFAAASDPSVEVCISRDCDSRLNIREACAVDAWLESSKSFHIMRDHPAHGFCILGGMWGVKAPLLRDMDSLIASYVSHDRYQVDQEFLKRLIYNRVKDDALIHDEFFHGEKFPVLRDGTEFVGKVFDEDERTSSAQEAELTRALRQSWVRRQLRALQFRLTLEFLI